MKKILNRRKTFCSVLIFFIITCAFISTLVIIGEDKTEDQKFNDRKVNKNQLYEKNDLKSSLGQPIRYASISQNATYVRRVFESVEFIVNITDFIPDGANYTEIEITFKNGDILNDDMNETLGTNNWTYIYTPKYNDSLGLAIVKFGIYNETGGLLNAFTTETNFTICANCGINPSLKTEYKRNQILFTTLVIEDSDNFNWIISVVDSNVSSQENVLFIVGTDIHNIEFVINESFAQENKLYYIKINMTEISTNKWASPYFQFKVLLPESILIHSSIKFNPSSVFRTSSCSLTLNVSAQENGLSLDNITVTFLLKNPNSATIINNEELKLNLDNTFSISFSISASSPAGIYTYIITTKYKGQEIEQYSGTLKVKNNPPEIDGYEINGYDNEERISVNYGEDLVFKFDVFDVEGIAYITLLLINEEGDEYEITEEYEDDLEITVRTAELITGTWDIYVTVTDTDGVSVDLDDDFNTAPQKITVIPDTFGQYFSWIMLIIGLISGVILGTAISHYILKSQKIKPEKKIEKKKTKPKEEKIPEKGKPTPVKPKTEKKLIKEEKPERKEQKAPRKIKRKLK